MKINPIAILIIVVFLASCGMSDKRLIAEAENLVEEHPDSALEVLNGVESVDRLSNEWTARYWIATAMVQTRERKKNGTMRINILLIVQCC